MNRNYLFLILMAMIYAMGIGCEYPCGLNVQKTILLSEADNGKTIEINLDDKVKVTLPSNPTTGFSWQNVLPDESIVVQEGNIIYIEDPMCLGRNGCGGTETFNFKGDSLGEGKISLVYKRPWEEEPPLYQFEVTVIVNSPPVCKTVL